MTSCCPTCHRHAARVESLLERIAEALDPQTTPEDAADAPTCACARVRGAPISSCPICGGSGHPRAR